MQETHADFTNNDLSNEINSSNIEPINEPVDNSVNKPSTCFFNKPIVKLTLKTIMWFMVAFSLFCVIFIWAFPFRTMTIYRNIGLNRAALHHASRVVNRYEGTRDYLTLGTRNNARFSEGLFLTSSLSGQFVDDHITSGDFNSNRARRVAERNLHYTNLLLNEYYGLAFEQMNTTINPLRLASARSRNDRPHLFSYEAVLRRNQVRSRYILGETTALATSFTSRTNTFYLRIAPWNDASFEFEAHEINSLVFLLIEINALLELELKRAGYNDIIATYYDGQRFVLPSIDTIHGNISWPRDRFSMLFNNSSRTTLMTNLQGIIPNMVNFILEMPPEDSLLGFSEHEMLRRTFWLMNISQLAFNVRLVTHILNSIYALPSYANAFSDWVARYDAIQVSTTIFSLITWYYRYVLPEYFAFVP